MASYFDTGMNTLDKILESGVTLAEKYFDYGTSKNEAVAQAAIREAELARLQQLENLGQTSTIGDVSFPSWLIPAGLVTLGVVFLFKKK